MRDRLRTAVDVALGAAVTGWRGARRRAAGLAEAGRASRERLQERVDRETETWRESGREQINEVEERVREETTRVLHGMHLVTREDLEDLSRRITQLQTRLAEIERRVTDPDAGNRE
ncbi:MAG: phasin family protein [Thiohalorhabdus sp.]|uniref:phasin family protein n=1 Tax=Thiohalorhabdus sp. TaxID=3094134 RepID=UPI0039806DA0